LAPNAVKVTVNVLFSVVLLQGSAVFVKTKNVHVAWIVIIVMYLEQD